MIKNNTKYLITFVKISLSFPTVLPTVFAATSQIWLIFNSAPVLACNLENSTLLDVELPVTNVPIDPIRGATNG